MNLETLVQQLREAKAKKLILKATVSTAMLPASVVIQLPHTTTGETIDKLRQFLKDTFPNTTIQQWRYGFLGDEMNIICMSFTVDYPHLLQGEVPRGETPLHI